MKCVCKVCGQRVFWRSGRGWVHKEGGRCMMVCRECGWRGALSPAPNKCPECGSGRLRIHHGATPVPMKP
jgi:ribosomal protein L40E